MANTAIKVENLGKKYIIDHQQEQRYVALRDVITNKVKNIGKNKLEKGIKEEFWALKDINFEIKQGDKVGIIGRNGAGKSTLLKLLSQITDPTTGRITINGRVASLLEVGTGFHPELTGRENIYLNGSILGMSKQEIKKKFDEIVEFAEVEKFLDTPVKRYSSGMYMRLAFSVAANLEPDILVVDEVLAVGDIQFQKKCLGKMQEIGEAGRTLLFVSHNMEAVEKLCSKGIILKQGQLHSYHDNVRELISAYMSPNGEGNNLSSWINQGDRSVENEYFTPHKIEIVDEQDKIIQGPIGGMKQAYLQIYGETKIVHPGLMIGYFLYDETGTIIYYSDMKDQREGNWIRVNKGENKIRTRIPIEILKEAEYRIELQVVIHMIQSLVQPGKNAPCITLKIEGTNSQSPIVIQNRPGIIRPMLTWE